MYYYLFILGECLHVEADSWMEKLQLYPASKFDCLIKIFWTWLIFPNHVFYAYFRLGKVKTDKTHDVVK